MLTEGSGVAKATPEIPLTPATLTSASIRAIATHLLIDPCRFTNHLLPRRPINISEGKEVTPVDIIVIVKVHYDLVIGIS